MLPFFFIFFRDSQTGTKRFRLILDIFSLIHGKLDELVSSTETWYDRSFPDMFRIACSSMALGSIACRRLQLSIVTKYCISLPISVIFRFLKAFYSGTSFDFQSSCSACYHETTEILTGLGNSSPQSAPLPFNSFTTQSIYWPYFVFFVFIISNHCLYLSFSTIISTRSFTRVSLRWYFLPFFFNLLFFLWNTLDESRSSHSSDSSLLYYSLHHSKKKVQIWKMKAIIKIVQWFHCKMFGRWYWPKQLSSGVL